MGKAEAGVCIKSHNLLKAIYYLYIASLQGDPHGKFRSVLVDSFGNQNSKILKKWWFNHEVTRVHINTLAM